ncbi:hypothetical protein F2P79_024144 [Pimephales promelas]|nr:hypothetical protein F2P79_024144 [Pimephales promelas]
MGGSYSQADYEAAAFQIYKDVLQHEPCFLPDIGIDESLLKYSGSDSNAALQGFSNDMLDTVPGYVGSLGSVIGPLTSIPNAVGIGALVISMIIEIAIKSGTQTTDDDPYSLLRRVFGEEKASGVRDKMSEYLKRHEIYMKNNQLLREEISRLEHQLSDHLTILRNSLLQDGQMSKRGFKIWVNGAAFHVQMLIHGARLDIQAGKPASDCVHIIDNAINVYLRHLDHLLEKYKTYKIKSDVFSCGALLCFNTDNSRLEDWYIGVGRAGSQPTVPVPFFPEVHGKLTRSWTFTAKNCLSGSSPLATHDGGAVKGYEAIPPVERSVVRQLMLLGGSSSPP